MATIELGRRSFLLLLGGSALGFGLATGLKTISQPPAKIIPTPNNSHTIYPGFIEDKVSVPLLQGNVGPELWQKGHVPWLLEATLNNPILLSTTKDLFSYVFNNLDQNRRLTPRELLIFSMQTTREKILSVPKLMIREDTDLDLENLHAATIPLAVLGCAPWWSREIYRKFGVMEDHLRDDQEIRSLVWDRQRGFGANVFPSMEPSKDIASNGKELNTGPDRTMHFLNHLFLVTEYLYAKKYSLKEAKAMPPGITMILEARRSIGNITSDQEEALAFSNLVGNIYELSMLRHPDTWPVINHLSDITEGPLDPHVGSDYRGNRLGALVSTDLTEAINKKQSIEPILNRLFLFDLLQYQLKKAEQAA